MACFVAKDAWHFGEKLNPHNPTLDFIDAKIAREY